MRWTYHQPTKTILPIFKAGIIAVSIVAPQRWDKFC